MNEPQGGSTGAGVSVGGTVRDVMTTEVVCVPPEMSVERLVGLFLERGISGAPVVDPAGRPLGVVSKTDLLRCQRLQDAGSELAAQAQDLMTPLVFSLSEGATVPQAAALMAYEGIHRAPVVSMDDRVVGIVSSLDVLRWLGREHGFVVPERPR